MTDQPWSAEPGSPQQQPGYPPQQPGYPPPPLPPPYPSYPQYGPPAVANDPSAPFGRHPVSGQPYSDKSKTVAGLLQLIGLFGVVGIGRMYAGYVGLGVAQLVVGLVTCGAGAVIWGLIDAVLILTDNVKDPLGRPLRD